MGNPARVGDEATFSIEVGNAGPDDAHLIEVTDVLPAGVTFVSADPSQGVYDEETGRWSVGSVEVDGSATLEITVTIDQTVVTNFAEITNAAAWDPDSTPPRVRSAPTTRPTRMTRTASPSRSRRP